jgi:PmbA protein
LEEILAIARKSAENAEVFQLTSTRTPVQFEANRLKQIQTKESISTALRIVKNGRIGFAQASGNIKARDLVDMALETCQFGHEANYQFPGNSSHKAVEVFDESVEHFSVDDMISTGEEIINAVRSNTPEILCEGAVSRGTAVYKIANTAGGHASYRRSNFSISMDGMLVRDGDILYVGDILSSCRPVHEYRTMIDEIIRQLDLARNNVSIKSGTFPVIFTPFGVSGALLSPLISAFNGKTVLDGASPLKDKKGQSVFDAQFNLHDDPTLPFQPGSTPWDDEGVPAVRNTLVEEGIVRQFYYDLHTAALAGTKSTGNGNRNGGLPAPSPHALMIGPGRISRSDMVKQIKEGLLIEQLMGAEQGNILNGDFSGNVLLGYKIENGEISGRVKDTMVHGNVYQLLKEIAALGNDARWIAGYINTPSIYCPAISVSSK